MTGSRTCPFASALRTAPYLHMEGGTMLPVLEEEWK